jgi:hypothetical protein
MDSQADLMYSRRTWLRGYLIVCAFAAMVLPLPVQARDAARDLRRLKGYCIADAATVVEVLTSSSGEKYLRLDNGISFKVELLVLDPLPFTDVIIFMKPLPKELVDQFKGKVPDAFLYSYKLLIDNEVFDAEPVLR